MKNLIKSIAILTLATSSTALFGQEAPPIIAVMGGYQSCPITSELIKHPTAASIAQISPNVKELTQEFYKNYGVKPKTLYSCYTGILSDLTLDRFELWLSPFPDFSVREVHTLYSSLLRDSAAITPLYQSLFKLLAETPSSKVYLIGHSYGAWSALHGARYLIERGRQITGLVTIDPISPLTCKPEKIITKLFRGKFPAGCLQAPSDFSAELLMSGLSWGRNFYQSQPLLHASSIPEFDQRGSQAARFANSAIRIGGFDPHSYLGYHAPLWDWIKQATISSYR